MNVLFFFIGMTHFMIPQVVHISKSLRTKTANIKETLTPTYFMNVQSMSVAKAFMTNVTLIPLDMRGMHGT